MRSSLWYDKPGVGFSRHGTNYIEQVFRRAHKADPQALIFYNEAEGEDLNGKSNAIYSLVNNFRRRGVPINGVELQMHIPKLDADVPAIAANIARLTALGAQVHITEVDVSLPLDSGGEARADDYRGIARVCLNSAGHGNSDLGIYRQILVDRFSFAGHSRTGFALRSIVPAKSRPSRTVGGEIGGRVPGH